MSSRLRRLLPVVVALSALAFVASRTDLHRLQAALSHAPLGLLCAVSALFTVANCGADTLAMYYVFRWFGLRLRYIDLYTIRAATYLLAVINYHAGQLGIIGFLHRAGRVPLSQASGWVLFIIGVWVGLLLLLASGGALLGGAQAAALLPVLALFALGMVVYVTILLTQPRWLREAPAPPPPGASRLQRLMHRGWDVGIALLRPLLAAGLLGHVRALLVRLPHLLILLAWHYLALRIFGVEVPTLTAALYLPVVFAVASLPISPQGLGTAQVAALFFFREYSQGGDEAVLAYSLSMTAISTVGSLAMGLLFLRRGAALGLNVSEEVEAPGAPGAPSGPGAPSPASIEPLPAPRAGAAR